MRALFATSLFVSSLGLIGCGSLGSMQSVASDPLGLRGQAPRGASAESSGWDTGTSRSDAVLYARDGSPVGPAPPGVVRTADQPLPHGLQDGVESRIVLLDLYQQAVDDRDELLLELELHDQLQAQTDLRIAELEAQLAARQTSLDEAVAAKEALELKTFELADRLATSTVLRLEAEKKYLETAIAARSGSLQRAGVELPSTGDDR